MQSQIAKIFFARRLVIIFLIIINVVLFIVYNPAYGLSFNRTNEHLEIKGPAILTLKNIADLSAINIEDETMIHLPDSIKFIVVEQYELETESFRKEIRAYTMQQTLFWTAATLIVVNAIVSVR